MKLTMDRFLILNGPNLNMLGIREPEIYGSKTLDELMAEVTAYASAREVKTKVFTSNSESALIDKLHLAPAQYQGVVFNPAAFTHYSYALRDAVASISIPVVEVHLTDIEGREDFRKISVIAPVCLAQYAGGGVKSYQRAIDRLIEFSVKQAEAQTGKSYT